MRVDDVSTAQDTSALWTALLQAKDDGDATLVRAIEARMRELAAERRYAHLSDEDLRTRINGLTRQREPKGMLAHSPDGGFFGAGGFDSVETSRRNAAIRANHPAGIQETLNALQAEWDRRHPRPGA